MYLLVIYNTNTGEIVATTTVEDPEAPLSGGIMIFVPDGKQLVRIDVSEPDNPIPVIEDSPIDEDRLALSIITGEVIIDDEN